MEYGALVIIVRGSTCVSVFIMGAGAPGGVRDPCPSACKTAHASVAAANPIAHLVALIAAPP